MQDPFAAAPISDEAQAVVEAPESPVEPPEPKKGKGITVDVHPNLVGFEGLGDSEKVRITYKPGVAYDVPWITVDFPSIDVAHDKLVDAERQRKLAVIFDITGRANVKFAELVAVHKPVLANTAPAAPANPSAPPAGATTPSNGETRSCQHGAMQYRTGVSAKTGKTWSAFMCPTPKGAPDQCAAEWIR